MSNLDKAEIGHLIDDLTALESSMRKTRTPSDPAPVIVREARHTIERLLQWRAEAIHVLNEWEDTWADIGRPGPLGHTKAAGVLAEFRRITDDNTRLLATIDALNIELAALRTGPDDTPVAP
jgi:hypothetical protein